MISIKNFKIVDHQKIHFIFSDDRAKTIDFHPFIGEDELSKPLSDPAYFQQVKLYENGRGIYWPNDYDFCPDFLYHYQADEKEVGV